MQGSSGVDLQEPRNVATLCNAEAAGVKHTDNIPEKKPYSTFSGTNYQNAEKHKLRILLLLFQPVPVGISLAHI